MNRKTWEQWANRIDEARDREAFGDLSNIAYGILNTFTITEKKETNDFVVCDHASSKCPDSCEHKIPHKAILDYYLEDKGQSYCDDQESPCGFQEDKFDCICK